jgi:hypothetical protein
VPIPNSKIIEVSGIPIIRLADKISSIDLLRNVFIFVLALALLDVLNITVTMLL